MSDQGKQTHRHSNLLQRLIARGRGQAPAITPSLPSSFSEPEPLADIEQPLVASLDAGATETGASEPGTVSGRRTPEAKTKQARAISATADTGTELEQLDSTLTSPVSPVPTPASNAGEATGPRSDINQMGPGPSATGLPATPASVTEKVPSHTKTTNAAEMVSPAPAHTDPSGRVPAEVSDAPQQHVAAADRERQQGGTSPLFTEPVLTSGEQYPNAAGRNGGSADQTVEVSISIGRVEIRPPVQPPAEQAKRRRPQPPMPLKEYLKKRDQGAL